MEIPQRNERSFDVVSRIKMVTFGFTPSYN